MVGVLRKLLSRIKLGRRHWRTTLGINRWVRPHPMTQHMHAPHEQQLHASHALARQDKNILIVCFYFELVLG